MPLYEYTCPQCSNREEYVLDYEERDLEYHCPDCQVAMVRVFGAPVIGKPAFQMKAILSTGEKIGGHFGKAAKREKK